MGELNIVTLLKEYVELGMRIRNIQTHRKGTIEKGYNQFNLPVEALDEILLNSKEELDQRRFYIILELNRFYFDLFPESADSDIMTEMNSFFESLDNERK